MVAITARKTRASVASFHLSSLLLVTFSVYVYRDVWPSLTFTLVPADRWEGALLWAKIGLLSVPGIVIPLITPRQYVPLDPNNDSQGEIPFLVSSSRALLTPSVAPTDDQQSRVDGVPFVYDGVFIPRCHRLLGISCSTLVARYASPARGLRLHQQSCAKELQSMCIFLLNATFINLLR